MADPEKSNPAAYWRANLRLLGLLLAIWFLASCGAGILWADALDRITVPGTGVKLGFWMAQQGSILVFLGIITVYAILMNRLDRRHGVEEE